MYTLGEMGQGFLARTVIHDYKSNLACSCSRFYFVFTINKGGIDFVSIGRHDSSSICTIKLCIHIGDVLVTYNVNTRDGAVTI